MLLRTGEQRSYAFPLCKCTRRGQPQPPRGSQGFRLTTAAHNALFQWRDFRPAAKTDHVSSPPRRWRGGGTSWEDAGPAPDGRGRALKPGWEGSLSIPAVSQDPEPPGRSRAFPARSNLRSLTGCAAAAGAPGDLGAQPSAECRPSQGAFNERASPAQ